MTATKPPAYLALVEAELDAIAARPPRPVVDVRAELHAIETLAVAALEALDDEAEGALRIIVDTLADKAEAVRAQCRDW